MPSIRTIVRSLYVCALVLAFVVTVGIGVLLDSKEYIFNSFAKKYEVVEPANPFPVGVNEHTKIIVEQPRVNTLFLDTLAEGDSPQEKWWQQVANAFIAKDWYQNLASPVSRIVVIWPGERHEEIAKHIGDILHWNTSEREEFTHLVAITDPIMREGKFYPGKYLVHRGASPAEVSELITDEFQSQVLDRYTDEVAAEVSLDTALIVASLIEREASDFENMREVSGVIWNRLFIDMPLQLDATLQYARGSRSYEPAWWPAVRPADKFINSPYNTYKNEGLPPTPIANPSVEAIIAALNPRQTDCLYYFHDDVQGFYCSETYEEHVQKLRSLYGRGR